CLPTAAARTSAARFRSSLERREDRCVPAVISEFPLTTALPAPQGITTGPDDGALWYTDPGANKIGRISTTSDFAPLTFNAITEFTLPTVASDPRGITTGPDNALWFTEFGTDRIGRVDLASGAITEFQLTVGSGPANIVTGP